MTTIHFTFCKTDKKILADLNSCHLSNRGDTQKNNSEHPLMRRKLTHGQKLLTRFGIRLHDCIKANLSLDPDCIQKSFGETVSFRHKEGFSKLWNPTTNYSTPHPSPPSSTAKPAANLRDRRIWSPVCHYSHPKKRHSSAWTYALPVQTTWSPSAKQLLPTQAGLAVCWVTVPHPRPNTKL